MFTFHIFDLREKFQHKKKCSNQTTGVDFVVKNETKMSSEQGQSSTKLKSKEEIFTEFQNLRTQQRNLVTNLNTLELDLKEHK